VLFDGHETDGKAEAVATGFGAGFKAFAGTFAPLIGLAAAFPGIVCGGFFIGGF
jgi:hypothetical protein